MSSLYPSCGALEVECTNHEICAELIADMEKRGLSLSKKALFVTEHDDPRRGPPPPRVLTGGRCSACRRARRLFQQVSLDLHFLDLRVPSSLDLEEQFGRADDQPVLQHVVVRENEGQLAFLEGLRAGGADCISVRAVVCDFHGPGEH